MATHDNRHPSAKPVTPWRGGVQDFRTTEYRVKRSRHLDHTSRNQPGTPHQLQSYEDRTTRDGIVGFDDVGHATMDRCLRLKADFNTYAYKIPDVCGLLSFKKTTLHEGCTASKPWKDLTSSDASIHSVEKGTDHDGTKSINRVVVVTFSSSFKIAKEVQNMLDLEFGQIGKVFTSPTTWSGSGRQFKAMDSCFLISKRDGWKIERIMGADDPVQNQWSESISSGTSTCRFQRGVQSPAKRSWTLCSSWIAMVHVRVWPEIKTKSDSTR